MPFTVSEFRLLFGVRRVVPLKAIGFYEVSQHNRAKCLLFGFVFSAGLIAIFALLGLMVVVLRKFAWGEQFSNPWFLAGIVTVLAVMGFSTFGAFTVGLPQWVYRIAPRHDTYAGNFLFGILTAVLSTPYHGYWKNLAIALTDKHDAHVNPLWDHGHIKFWSVKTLSRLLGEAGFVDLRFDRVGRIKPLAKSMIAIARKPG